MTTAVDAPTIDPYAIGEGWTLYDGECAAVMRDCIPDESVDMFLTSPPYDNLRSYNGYKFDFFKIAREMVRTIKPGGVIVWVVGDQTMGGSETGTSFKQALYFMELGLGMETMIYDTGSQGAKGANYLYSQAHEFMFVFMKGRPSRGSLIYDHKNIYGGTRNTSTRRRENGDRRKDRFITPEFSKRTNVWYYPTGGGVSGDALCHDHPAPFPEALARDHIVSWSNPGDLVLDPMCGSGTTLKMALMTGRRAIGIDISSDYLEIAKQRIALTRLPLFEQVVEVDTPVPNLFSYTEEQR